MLDTTFRQRPLALLAALVLAQVLLLAFQIKRDHDVRLIRLLGRGGGHCLSSAAAPGPSRKIRRHLVGLHRPARHSRRECAPARRVDQLRLRNRDLEGQAAEAQRLSILLNFHDAHPDTPMLAAQVIGASADPSSHTLFMNRGDARSSSAAIMRSSLRMASWAKSSKFSE